MAVGATPAARAMSSTLASTYPSRENTVVAASMICLRRDGRWAGRLRSGEDTIQHYSAVSIDDMTVDLDVRKPANRPSRRHYLVDAAVELFSLEPWEVVTVADIVERAGMTPATFYYHFSSREELLEEIVQDFARKWIGMVERLLDAADTPDALCAVA